MIVTCPECSTRYHLKEDDIGANGRTVRCSQCEASWFVAADFDAATLRDNETEFMPHDKKPKSEFSQSESLLSEDPLSPLGLQNNGMIEPHVAMRDKADNQRRRRRLGSVAAIWAIPLLIVGSGVLGSYVFRQDIVNAEPATATVYKAFGINVSLSGLTIERPVTESAMVDGKAVLVINSAVRNISSGPRDVPLIEFSLHNRSGDRLVSWLVDTKSAQLDQKGRVEFGSEYPEPPLDAVNLRYKFADDGAAITQSLDEAADVNRDETLSVLQ